MIFTCNGLFSTSHECRYLKDYLQMVGQKVFICMYILHENVDIQKIILQMVGLLKGIYMFQFLQSNKN